jgi:hypothetical protein
VVTTEVGFCSFCGRPRNLRHEAHQLGTLVRTIVTCETCHRTLSSTIGVATAEPAVSEPVAPEPERTPGIAAAPSAAKAAAKPGAKTATQRKPQAATKSTASKSAAKKKTR